MMSVPPREALAAVTRQAIEVHDEWESPHSFQTLHWDGREIATGTYMRIMPDIYHHQYPGLMAQAAYEQQRERPDDPPCAYLLQVEAFGTVEPGKDASEEERDRYQRARLGRTFHELPGAQEVCAAYCADVHGRLWSAVKRRGNPGEISEHFYPPHSPRQPGGLVVNALLSIAYTTGTARYGLPGPQGTLN